MGLHPIIGDKVKVSLIDVKTPSINSKDKCAKNVANKAKYFVRKLLKDAKYIEVNNLKRARSFGVQGNIKIDNKDLSKILLKKKFAVSLKDLKKTNWCNIG